MARKALNQKRREQAELKELNAIQITIEASEANLQRIAALLLFADHLPVEYKPVPQLLPYEEPSDAPPVLEIDYNAVRNAIMKQLEPYVAKHGMEKAKALVASFGGERLKSVPESQLLGLLGALADPEAASE